MIKELFNLTLTPAISSCGSKLSAEALEAYRLRDRYTARAFMHDGWHCVSAAGYILSFGCEEAAARYLKAYRA